MKDMMTETEDDLLAEIDRFLAEISHQTIVEQSKVIDFVLDLRTIHGTMKLEQA